MRTAAEQTGGTVGRDGICAAFAARLHAASLDRVRLRAAAYPARRFVALLCAAALGILSGCAEISTSVNADTPLTVRDLAWDGQGGAFGAVSVYLPEDGAYVPFLVLAERYGGADGGTLLLRRDLLPTPQPINDYSSYYADSAMDWYLNGDYRDDLAAVGDWIVPVPVTITADAAIGVSETGTEEIVREIFLLSCTETGADSLRNAAREGEPLSFFRDPENRIARSGEGAAGSWWLRTADTAYVSCTFGVGPDGTVGSGNSFNENGVRPALCVSPSAPVSLREDIVEGERVLALGEP